MESIIETDAHRRLAQESVEWLTVEERAIFYGELLGYARARGWKTGWAAMKYRERFGYWPEANVKETPEIACSDLTELWIKASMRDWWKEARRR